jgi:hypothetical protein
LSRRGPDGLRGIESRIDDYEDVGVGDIAFDRAGEKTGSIVDDLEQHFLCRIESAFRSFVGAICLPPSELNSPNHGVRPGW